MKKIVLSLCIGIFLLTGCGETKPSKAAVKESTNRIIVKTLGVTPTAEQKKVITEYVDCYVDDTYDDMSAKTLKKIVDAKTTNELSAVEGTQKEKDALESATSKCRSTLSKLTTDY